MTMKNGTLTSDIQGGEMKLWFARLVIRIVGPIYWWSDDVIENYLIRHYFDKKYQDANLDQ